MRRAEAGDMTQKWDPGLIVFARILSRASHDQAPQAVPDERDLFDRYWIRRQNFGE